MMDQYKRTAWISFTDQGEELMRSLAEQFGGDAMRCGEPLSLSEWTSKHFFEEDALVFIGAAGIAVRAIAPHVKSKVTDPAVLVIDETGRFVIPLLSGHLGGANELAGIIASFLHAEAVITTATDRRNVFAVDEWARVHDCAIGNSQAIKRISGSLLKGERISVWSEWEIQGERPDYIDLAEKAEKADVILSVHRPEYLIRETSGTVGTSGTAGSPFLIFPRILVLGVGMKQGISEEALESFFQELLRETGIAKECICSVSTIDLKAEETGLKAFCLTHSWALDSFCAEELKAVPGHFSGSSFVLKTVGVDNVCERSAVLKSGGKLLLAKRAGNGITMAVAEVPFCPDWRWKR